MYMKKQKRIKVKGGSARIYGNCPKETIDAIKEMVEIIHKTDLKQLLQARVMPTK